MLLGGDQAENNLDGIQSGVKMRKKRLCLLMPMFGRIFAIIRAFLTEASGMGEVNNSVALSWTDYSVQESTISLTLPLSLTLSLTVDLTPYHQPQTQIL